MMFTERYDETFKQGLITKLLSFTCTVQRKKEWQQHPVPVDQT